MSIVTRRNMLIQSAGALALAGCKRFSAGTATSRGGNPRVGLLFFAPEEGAELCMRGIFEGLKEQGLEKGRNLEVLSSHAQGEISNIPMLVQNFVSQGVDLILTMTTPCLTAACSLAKNKHVVFTYCYDPVAAGRGHFLHKPSSQHHRRGLFSPGARNSRSIQKLVPHVKAVGTVYNTSEANSVKVISVAREASKEGHCSRGGNGDKHQRSISIRAGGVLPKGAGPWVTGDNTALQSFDGIVKATRNAKLPLIINDPEFTARGAVACVGLGWHPAGKAGGVLAARVLRGEDPRNLPFEEVAMQKLVLNHEAASTLGIVFPPDVIKAAAQA